MGMVAIVLPNNIFLVASAQVKPFADCSNLRPLQALSMKKLPHSNGGFPLLYQDSGAYSRWVMTAGQSKAYNTSLNRNRKVLDFIQFDWPRRTELRTFRWKVPI